MIPIKVMSLKFQMFPLSHSIITFTQKRTRLDFMSFIIQIVLSLGILLSILLSSCLTSTFLVTIIFFLFYTVVSRFRHFDTVKFRSWLSNIFLRCPSVHYMSCRTVSQIVVITFTDFVNNS